jgi:hypothetical protein
LPSVDLPLQVLGQRVPTGLQIRQSIKHILGMVSLHFGIELGVSPQELPLILYKKRLLLNPSGDIDEQNLHLPKAAVRAQGSARRIPAFRGASPVAALLSMCRGSVSDVDVEAVVIPIGTK